MIYRWTRVGVATLTLLALNAAALPAQSAGQRQGRITQRSVDRTGEMVRRMSRTQARTHQLGQSMAGHTARAQTQQRNLEQHRFTNRIGENRGSQAGRGIGTAERARRMRQDQSVGGFQCEGCTADGSRWYRFRAENWTGVDAPGEGARLRNRVGQPAAGDETVP